MTGPLVSIILPVYNQEDHIEAIVDEYVQALSGAPVRYEMLLVTNGCRDRSPELCQGLAAKFDHVRAIDTKKGGWGYAVKVGIGNAQGDLICYTNSARTSAEQLKLILFYALSYPGVVIKANRKVRDNWRRRLGSLLYNLECRALFDLPIWDINGTPKVFPRSFSKLLALKQDGDLIDAEFTAICRREGYPVLEVPILSSKRHSGKSTTSYKSALKMYWGAYKLWRSLN